MFISSIYCSVNISFSLNWTVNWIVGRSFISFHHLLHLSSLRNKLLYISMKYIPAKFVVAFIVFNNRTIAIIGIEESQQSTSASVTDTVEKCNAFPPDSTIPYPWITEKLLLLQSFLFFLSFFFFFLLFWFSKRWKNQTVAYILLFFFTIQPQKILCLF